MTSLVCCLQDAPFVSATNHSGQKTLKFSNLCRAMVNPVITEGGSLSKQTLRLAKLILGYLKGAGVDPMEETISVATGWVSFRFAQDRCQTFMGIHVHNAYLNYRWKFGSQTSDNMDRWKSRGGKSQRREEQKREDQRREIMRRKKTQVREKVEKSRGIMLFQ